MVTITIKNEGIERSQTFEEATCIMFAVNGKGDSVGTGLMGQAPPL